MTLRLFHVSDQPGIERFEPRPAPSPDSRLTGAMVWAVGERLLHNYLLPRDCPRVTFYAGPNSDPADVAWLLGVSSARHVVAIEAGWLPAMRREHLYLYEMPPEPFTATDVGAGYYVARQPVVPLAVTVVDDLLGALLARDVELRVMPSLWPLSDAVVASTLHFSNIRMRNARPRLAAAPT